MSSRWSTAPKAKARFRETIVFGVDPGHPFRRPSAEGNPEQRSQDHDEPGQQTVMRADVPVAVAECLEDRDLPALGLDDPPHQQIQQEGRDREEDGGKHDGHHAELVELLREEAMRDLVLAAHGADPAVAGQM